MASNTLMGPPPRPIMNGVVRQRSRNDNDVDSNVVNGSQSSARGNTQDVNAMNPGSSEDSLVRDDDLQSQSNHGSQHGGAAPAASSTSSPTRDRAAAASEDLTSTEQNDESLESSRDPMADDEQTNDDDDFTSDAADPQYPMEHFPWDDLMARYHEKMHDLQGQEDQILQEFNGLCDVFLPCRCF
jgi:hypothetical protein